MFIYKTFHNDRGDATISKVVKIKLIYDVITEISMFIFSDRCSDQVHTENIFVIAYSKFAAWRQHNTAPFYSSRQKEFFNCLSDVKPCKKMLFSVKKCVLSKIGRCVGVFYGTHTITKIHLHKEWVLGWITHITL